MGPESLKAYKKQKFFWSDTYLITAEENFDSIFDEIFEEEFINHIFSEHEALIDKEEFVEAIAGNLLKQT